MKEKELSSTDKRRRTTLRKKNVEELVNIILRKDDIERKLQKSIETFKNLQDVNDKRINNLKDSLAKSEEIQVAQEQTINNYSDIIGSLKTTIAHKDEVIEEYKSDAYNYSKDADSLAKVVESRNKSCRILLYIIIGLIVTFIASTIFL